MVLRLARNLAVKIRVFYKTDLPGSAHRVTPVLRSLTSPLCRSTNERFRSSWHGRPSARIPYPRRPAPGSTFPLVSSSSTAFGETPTPSRASVVLKDASFAPIRSLSSVVPSASELYKSGRNVPSGSRYARHTIHGDLPCFFTGYIHVRQPLSAPISPSANRVSGRHPPAVTEPKIDRSGKDYRPCAMWP